MSRNAWFAGSIVGFGLAFWSARDGAAQVPPPPAPGIDAPAPGVGLGLDRLSRRMSEAIRDLGEDITASMGQSPNGQFLARDAQELERAAGEWYASARNATDPYQLRRSFSGVDTSWHRLRDQLAAPGVAPPAVADEIRRVEQADAAIHQALNVNAYPPNIEAAPAPPSGLDETRRLAYSLAQRGEGLASTVQSSYGGNPGSANLVNDSAQVAQLADAFYESLNNPASPPQPEEVRQNFAQIIQRSNGLGISLDQNLMPPPVRTAWDAYTTVHNLLRANLNLVNATIDGLPPADAPIPANVPVGIPYNPNPTAQVGQWAEQLDRQVDELLANFAPTAGVVPEGREMLVDMTRLRDHTRDFRRDVAQGLDPTRLAYEFRDCDADWQRLARRVNRIARGRTGPNIQRGQQIGQTCEQIHRALGMPGYAPTIQPF